MARARTIVVSLALVMSVVVPALSQKDQRRPLTAVAIDAITQLVMLEDTRQFDQPAPDQRNHSLLRLNRSCSTI